MIRAYVPWYLVRNYLAFAFVVCLCALQLADGHRRVQRARFVVALVMIVAVSLAFYAFAPELLTPGPAGGELTLLFGGTALLAVGVTGGIRYWVSGIGDRTLEVGGQGSEAGSDILRFEIWHLIFPILSVVVFLFDVPLFRTLNGLALRTPLIDVPAQFLMNDYIVPTALVLTLLALWFAGRDAHERIEFQRTVLRALLALLLASVTLKLINEFYFRPRPFALDDGVRLLFYHPSDSTLPSNAATVSFSLALAVWLRQKRWGAAMLTLAIGMTLARVVSGVHYPADIVVGVWLGGIWAWLVNRAAWLDHSLDIVVGVAHQLRLA